MTAATRRRVPFLDLGALHAELQPELEEAVLRVVRSGRLLLGPELAAFEEAWAGTVGARFAVGVGNGLDALSLGLRALGVGAGDEVLVPSHTFVATWLAVAHVGAVPVPVDVRSARANYAAATDTWAALIRRAVTSEGIPDVARAAGCTRATVYARIRDTPGTSGT